MNNFWQDVRFAFRVLLNNRGFAAIAVLTLALGIGANTALFSVVNGVILNPLPFPEPENLFAVYTKTSTFEQSSITFPNFSTGRRTTIPSRSSPPSAPTTTT